MKDQSTPFMIARQRFHAARTTESAKLYADSAIQVHADDRPVRIAVATELRHAGYADDATRAEK